MPDRLLLTAAAENKLSFLCHVCFLLKKKEGHVVTPPGVNIVCVYPPSSCSPLGSDSTKLLTYTVAFGSP